MREIKAIVKPHRLDAVLDALRTHSDLPGVTISEIRGFGRTVGRAGDLETGSSRHGIVEMVKLECVVDDDAVDAVVDLIRQAAHTGGPGDGKIFLYDVREVIGIRTGQRSSTVDRA